MPEFPWTNDDGGKEPPPYNSFEDIRRALDEVKRRLERPVNVCRPEPLTIEVVIEYPDLSPTDVELLDEALDEIDETSFDLATRLEDLRDRVARMILTAVERA